MEPPPIVSKEEWQSAHEAVHETRSRGVEALGSVWTFLDLTPFGRQEAWEDSPPGYPQTPPYEWWRAHDAYRAER